MKKKYLKIAAFIVALGLIGFIGYFANGLLGNPVSKMMAKRTAKQYLEKQYPDTDYYIESVKYSFKSGGYYAHIRSKTSADTAFECSIDMFGGLEYDDYEEQVEKRFRTASRIDMEYRELTDTVFTAPTFPYQCSIAFGTLEIAEEESLENSDPYQVPPYSLKQEQLELDKKYDMKEVGREAGHLVIYMEQPDVTMEQVADKMLTIKKQFDDAEIPFAAMDFSLSSPKEEGKQSEENINVAHFLYEEIYEDGMVERVKVAADELEAYYAEEDAKNK